MAEWKNDNQIYLYITHDRCGIKPLKSPKFLNNNYFNVSAKSI